MGVMGCRGKLAVDLFIDNLADGLQEFSALVADKEVVAPLFARGIAHYPVPLFHLCPLK